MTDNFKKIKSKIIIEKLLISLFIGLFIGVLTSSILVLVYKQLGLEYSLLMFILIGVGVFVLLSLILFFILKPNNIKVAKRIDKQLALKEKVHTMVEYSEKSGLLVDLQREDATNKLNEIPVKKFKLKFSPFLLILPLIVIPLCITSIVVKGKDIEEPPYVEPPVSGDPFIIQQIRDLIREVNEDVNLMTPVKEAYVGHLEDLITAINKPEIMRYEEVEAVNLTITNVGYSSINLNSIDEITMALSNSNMDEVHNLGSAIASYDLNRVNDALDKIFSYVNLISANQRQTNYNNLVTECFQKVDDERLDESDEFYQEFVKLKADLALAIADVNYNDAISELAKNTKDSFGDAIIRQNETLSMANYIEERLRAIFELPDNEEPVNPTPPVVSGDGNNPTIDNPGGGGGHGNIIFAGDDLVYDPDEGLIEYYKVITKYSNYIQGLVQDGVISEELANYYIEYFNKLYEENED